MTTIEKKRRQRFQFLKLVYEKTEGNKYQSVNMWNLGEELGWDKQTAKLTVQYLVGESLIEYSAMGGSIAITHFGVVEIERALTHPEEDTTYFPAVVNIMSGDFRGAILNIDSTLTNLSQNIGKLPGADADVKDELKQLIDQLRQALEEASSEQAEEAEAVVWAAETLIEAKSAEKPNRVKIEITKEGLKKAAENIASVMPTVLTIAEKIVSAIDRLK
jgi:ElaB/YqjD/DUF883 family membrane-anchored ribosome-binding protein